MFQFLEVFGRAVIGVDHFSFNIAGGRHAGERHNHAGIVGQRVAIHVLASGAVHPDAGRGGHIYADFGRIVDPDAVLDNFSFQAGLAEFLRDVVGGGLVFWSPGHVRRLSQGAQVRLREFGIGNREKAALDRRFSGGILESKDRGGAKRSSTIWRRRTQKRP